MPHPKRFFRGIVPPTPTYARVQGRDLSFAFRMCAIATLQRRIKAACTRAEDFYSVRGMFGKVLALLSLFIRPWRWSDVHSRRLSDSKAS